MDCFTYLIFYICVVLTGGCNSRLTSNENDDLLNTARLTKDNQKEVEPNEKGGLKKKDRRQVLFSLGNFIPEFITPIKFFEFNKNQFSDDDFQIYNNYVLQGNELSDYGILEDNILQNFNPSFYSFESNVNFLDINNPTLENDQFEVPFFFPDFSNLNANGNIDFSNLDANKFRENDESSFVKFTTLIHFNENPVTQTRANFENEDFTSYTPFRVDSFHFNTILSDNNAHFQFGSNHISDIPNSETQTSKTPVLPHVTASGVIEELPLDEISDILKDKPTHFGFGNHEAKIAHTGAKTKQNTASKNAAPVGQIQEQIQSKPFNIDGVEAFEVYPTGKAITQIDVSTLFGTNNLQ
ncbi:uncharacterized protein LOC136026597 [Artemia franciscana]|uniref:uncharacterized protein LOC136026597 n=1 Tax=Artemia franciscana TaxID=6661 RepID=UPI0032DB2E6C